MHEYQNFSSMQPEIERHFVPFERRTVEDTKKAWTIGLGSAGGVLLLSVILVLSFDKPEPLHADALDTDVPAERRAPRPAATPPAPVPTEAPADSETAGETDGEVGDEAGEAGEAGEPSGGEGESAEAGAPTEGAAAAPPPPKGATKAPPSALVNQ